MTVQRTVRMAVAAAALGVLLSGCATVPPPTDAVAKADLSLRKAEQAGAAQVAPLELRQAREKLQEARDKMNDSDTADAESAAHRSFFHWFISKMHRLTHRYYGVPVSSS